MYQHVAVFTLEGGFVGYAVKDPQANKLQSTNLYAESEGPQLSKRLSELNDEVAVRGAWPDARDPDVEALVANPEFEPLDMVEDDVIDMDHSYLVYLQVPEIDERGEPTGREVDGTELDRNASVIKTKKEMVPKNPSDFFARTKKACEIVARQRMA